ncbi:hypothetical protein ACFLRF_00350 [Candidatus Altiarchaeota archaeon]
MVTKKKTVTKKKAVKKAIKKKAAKKKVVKKKAVKKKAITKKAIKKTAKKEAAKLSKSFQAHEKQMKKKLADIEKKLIENYRVACELSGKDWKKEKALYEKKVKAKMASTEKTVKAQMKKYPEGSAVAAAAVGAVLGAVAMSLLTRKK